jgi:excisionase family DNA binding protein
MQPLPARTPESPDHRRLCSITDRLLTAAEVADVLGVTTRWVYAEARADRIPHIRLGRYLRFHPADLEHWLVVVRRGTVA